MPRCEVSLGQRCFRSGEFPTTMSADGILLMDFVKGGVGNRVTARSKYGTKKPKLDT